MNNQQLIDAVDAFHGRSAWEQALDCSRSTTYRHEVAGIIPSADVTINGRPYWRQSTIKRTLDKLAECGVIGDSSMAPPKSPGRPKKSAKLAHGRAE